MGRSRGRATGSGSRQSRRFQEADQELPTAYRELLSDTLSPSISVLGEEGRTVKKRRVGGRIITQARDSSEDHDEVISDVLSKRSEEKTSNQTAFNDSSDSEGSDEDFENVDLEGNAGLLDENEEASQGLEAKATDELKLVLGGKVVDLRGRFNRTKRSVTAKDRKMRLEVHKINILCLMSHIHLRNHWCNDGVVQAPLKRILSEKTISYLQDDENQSQFQRNRSLLEGLEQAIESFRATFRISARGMARAYWNENEETGQHSKIPDDIDLPIQKLDFRTYAKKLKASRDVGAQLFCAMLRSIGVDARLVCSLQPLPFNTATKETTPSRQAPNLIVSYPEIRVSVNEDDQELGFGSDASTRTADSSSMGSKINIVRSKLNTGHGGTSISQKKKPSHSVSKYHAIKGKNLRESHFPVYWVEAFDAAYQKWVCVDPLVTNKSIDKPHKLVPPANDTQNSLSYVIAFEQDGSARDVTRRYSKAYNAKTRKVRVECTKDGTSWWKRVMRLYRRSIKIVRDQVEDAELAAKEAAEEMPRNVQDFKDHPYYALERHLRRHEVIHPKKEIGRVASGKGMAGADKDTEPIFRRRDVHLVKSADSWYRLGREIKTGEQPLKWLQRRRQHIVLEDDEVPDEEEAGSAMYAGFQTCVYQAPPVVGGRVPKNQYGNLDIYVATMIPPGGVHIQHPDTARAARLLGINYADAVTGFQFKGRHGTAVVNGAVIPVQFLEAIEATIKGYEEERLEGELLRRSATAIRYWKRFFAGLQIRERIEGYRIEGDISDPIIEVDEMDETEDSVEGFEGGGFFLDRDAVSSILPTAGKVHHSPIVNKSQHLERILHGGLDKGAEEASAKPMEATIDTNEDDLLGSQAGGFFVDDAESEGSDQPLENVKNHIFQENPKELTHGVREENKDIISSKSLSESMNEQSSVSVNKDDQILNDTNQNIVDSMSGIDKSAVAHEPLLVLAEAEKEEARLAQQLYESARSFSRPEGAIEIDKEALSATATEVPDTAIPTKKGLPEEQVRKDKSEESDRGSLLSHDPEDEDADPDWLA